MSDRDLRRTLRRFGAHGAQPAGTPDARSARMTTPVDAIGVVQGDRPAAQAVMLSFELAAERCDDLTPLVYQRLFADQPDLEALFWREPKRQIEGEMLSRAIEAIFDFIGERRYADMMIRNEAVTHDGYEVPPEIFRIFFPAVRTALRDLLARDWTQAMEEAWAALLTEIDSFVVAAFPDRAMATPEPAKRA